MGEDMPDLPSSEFRDKDETRMMPSKSFQYVLGQYDEMAVELSKYSNGKLSYQKARQLIRTRLPLKPIQKLISAMKQVESHLSQLLIIPTGDLRPEKYYEHMQNQVDAYFMVSKDKRYSKPVTLELRTRLYSSIIRKVRGSCQTAREKNGS